MKDIGGGMGGGMGGEHGWGTWVGDLKGGRGGGHGDSWSVLHPHQMLAQKGLRTTTLEKCDFAFMTSAS